MNKTITQSYSYWIADYTLIEHKDGSISVRAPRAKTDTIGGISLGYKKIKINKHIEFVRECFADDEYEHNISDLVDINEHFNKGQLYI